MAEIRKYEVWICLGCGEQITDPPGQDLRTLEYKRGHYHDPPEDWLGGEDPWFDAIPLPATDDRDVDRLEEEHRQLLEAIEAHRSALPAGDWKISDEDKALYELADQMKTSSSPGETNSTGTSSCPTCGQPVKVHHGKEGTSYYLPAVEDSRLQELLEWAKDRKANARAYTDDEHYGERCAFEELIDRIHQLQANEEKGGET